MLFQTSYHSKETKEEIDTLVGKSIGIIKMIKMRGIGSQRFLVDEANEEVQELLERQNTPPYTNIELRPKGIMLWFRVKLDSYVLVLPYYKLSIFKNTDDITFHSDQWKLKLIPAHNAKLNISFVQKMLRMKAETTQDSFR